MFCVKSQKWIYFEHNYCEFFILYLHLATTNIAPSITLFNFCFLLFVYLFLLVNHVTFVKNDIYIIY